MSDQDKERNLSSELFPGAKVSPESVFDKVTIEEVRDGRSVYDFTGFAQELTTRLADNQVDMDMRETISLAMLWRIADANAAPDWEGKDKEVYLQKLYEYFDNEGNEEVKDSVISALLTVVYYKEKGMGLGEMSEKMQTKIVEYVGKRLSQTKTTGDSENFQKLAKLIGDVVRRYDAGEDTEVDTEEDEDDDLLFTNVHDSESEASVLAEEFKKLMTPEVEKAIEDQTEEDVKGFLTDRDKE